MEDKYVLNLENIIKFIFESDNKRDSDSEITEVYISDDETKDLVLSTKQLREVKGSDNSPKFTIRYDLFKTLLDTIINMSDDEASTLGEKIVLNTMLNEELITKVN